jgi:hypothetical protein
VELTWFRRPAAGEPGTLNLCYNAVDRHVIRGAAEQVAVRRDAGDVDHAGLLEQVGALAGAMRGLGVDVGTVIAADLQDPFDRLLVLLAALRLGAAFADATAPAPDLAVVDRPGLTAGVRIHRGLPVEDEVHEVDWDMAYRAGRTDPAPCADVPGDAPAYLLDGGAVATRDALGHGSWMGEACATLAAGRALHLTGGGE